MGISEWMEREEPDWPAVYDYLASYALTPRDYIARCREDAPIAH